MSIALLEDIERHPECFDLQRPVLAEELEALEVEIDFPLPDSYRSVLQTRGQGILFDNESLLGVHEIDDGLGDLVSVNRELRDRQGADPALIVFHLGSGGLHAFDTAGHGEPIVVALDEETLQRGEIYESFEDWYVDYLRPAYASVLELE